MTSPPGKTAGDTVGPGFTHTWTATASARPPEATCRVGRGWGREVTGAPGKWAGALAGRVCIARGTAVSGGPPEAMCGVGGGWGRGVTGAPGECVGAPVGVARRSAGGVARTLRVPFWGSAH
ncbi:hypothetical protein GCM10022214_41050 [Actinomadura miaoliensis]|uniref:Uncharacterized protein n=1 Tax=Actinomadura miaoliensis TaxID=430685 RepID=A0ABP7W3D4_9ACTN